jgi:hypothetical protein
MAVLTLKEEAQVERRTSPSSSFPSPFPLTSSIIFTFQSFMSDIHTLRYIKPVPVLPCTDIDRTISFFAELTGWKVSGKHPGFVAISAGFGSEVTIWYKEEEAREESGLGLGEVVVLLEVSF